MARAYSGSEPYLFVSYSHKDAAAAMEIINRLQSLGCRVWFDGGIELGREWDDFIAEHLENCGSFVSFISENYLASKNCKDELKLALELSKPMLLVYLENCQLTGGIRLRASALQHISKTDFSNPDDFYDKLVNSKSIRLCSDDNAVEEKTGLFGKIKGLVTEQRQPETKRNALLPEILRLKNAEVGSSVFFGSLAQDAGGKEATPIEWQVLDKKEGHLLLVSKKGLMAMPFNPNRREVSWESSELRRWLNGEFLKNSFSEAEQMTLASAAVSAKKNPMYNAPAGNDTTDKIFLLGITEAEKYFGSDEQRKCAPTDFAAANGASANGGACEWWLRTPGMQSDFIANVGSDGFIYYGGCDVSYSGYCVRPAIWIDLADVLLYEHGTTPEENYEEEVFSEGSDQENDWDDIADLDFESSPFNDINSPDELPQEAPPQREPGYYIPAFGPAIDETDEQPAPEEEEEEEEIYSPFRDYDTYSPFKEYDNVAQKTDKPATEEEEKKPTARPAAKKKEAAPSHIFFGTYPQGSDENEASPIEWLVLEKKGNNLLLLSKRGLDCIPFHGNMTEVDWENCALRRWLNSDFIDATFDESDLEMINVTAGDRVFLLSAEEAEKYFSTDEKRSCAPTEYAQAFGADVYYSSNEYGESGNWWLRSQGFSPDYAANVGNDGFIYIGGMPVNTEGCCIRPAVWITLDL